MFTLPFLTPLTVIMKLIYLSACVATCAVNPVNLITRDAYGCDEPCLDLLTTVVAYSVFYQATAKFCVSH